jgi:hypothetical protein
LREIGGELIGQVWKAAYALSQQDFEQARQELLSKTQELERLTAIATDAAAAERANAKALANQLAGLHSFYRRA